VTVANTSGITWTSSGAQVRYRWYAPNGAILFEGRSTTEFPATFAAGASQAFLLTILPPALPPGVAQAPRRRVLVRRGGQPTWPHDHGVLGAPTDPTGLTHLGAREYDSVIGRFVSVDPIMDLTSPQQMHGYSYANNNPTTLSDPRRPGPRRRVWWLDSRSPHDNLDPPVRVRFTDGTATFYGDTTVDERPARLRFVWADLTATAARWEQSLSRDAGASWERNWIMDYQRAE